jgi:hypothetical protein
MNQTLTTGNHNNIYFSLHLNVWWNQGR